MSEELKRGEGCIDGLRCPQCGNHERFLIGCSLFVEASADGSSADAIAQPHEWDDTSICICPDCKFRGVVGDFKEPESEDGHQEAPVQMLFIEAARDGEYPDLGSVLAELAIDRARELGAISPVGAHTTAPDHGIIVDTDDGECYRVDVRVRSVGK